MPLWEQLAIRLVAFVLLGALWLVSVRVARAICKDPDLRVWVTLLFFVADSCIGFGVFLFLVASMANPTARPVFLATIGIGLIPAAAGWALAQRRPRPVPPGTVEGFTPQETDAPTGWPESPPNQRDSRTARDRERKLVLARVLVCVDDIKPTPSQLLLTDRALWLDDDSLPRPQIRSITYSRTKDRITLEFQAGKDQQTMWINGTGMRRSAGTSSTYRLYQALKLGFLEPTRLIQPLDLRPVPGWRLAVATGLAAIGLVIALAPVQAHSDELQRAAATYEGAPDCLPRALTSACRQLGDGTLLDAGMGAHPDGSTGGEVWLAIHSGGRTIYADSPDHVAPTEFHAGDPVSFERYGGKVTAALADGVSLTTYDNPSWKAGDFRFLVYMVAGSAAFMGLSSGWLWIRYLRRPHEQQFLGQISITPPESTAA